MQQRLRRHGISPMLIHLLYRAYPLRVLRPMSLPRCLMCRCMSSQSMENSHSGPARYIRTDKSSAGRGGMMSKCNCAASLARDGYPVIIANGKRNNVIIDVLDNPDAI